jgi:hypothetical protein
MLHSSPNDSHTNQMLTAEFKSRNSAEDSASISATRILAAKAAFTTRRVDLRLARKLITHVTPQAGDLVLARVDVIGQHARIESPEGRRGQLYVGDEIIVAFGSRYAPDQFEAVVPDDLGPCDLVAGGGVAAKVLNRHGKMSKATCITPIGLLANASGQRLNLKQFAMVPVIRPKSRPAVVAVAGTSMNAGKTTTAAGLIHGLKLAGLKVGAAKVTGTGSGGDIWSMVDAGAHTVLDFTDMGHATTAGLCNGEIERTAIGLIDQLSALGSEAIVIEIADGVLQRETSGLLRSPRFRDYVDGVLFAAPDAMAAIGGVEWLRRHGLPLIGVSGLISLSPLAVREAESVMGCAVIGLDRLRNSEVAPKLCFSIPETSRSLARLIQ